MVAQPRGIRKRRHVITVMEPFIMGFVGKGAQYVVSFWNGIRGEGRPQVFHRLRVSAR